VRSKRPQPGEALINLDWVEGQSVALLLHSIERDIGPRRMRLLAVAFCERIAHLLPDDFCRAWLDVARRYADGQARRRDLAAVHDPAARRGLECLSTSFHWSDEGLPQAMRLCLNHGSRAIFYAMVFRTSLIKGEPIEEYRRTWEQLWAACPEWPGFRPERSSTDLLPAWQRALKRMCIDFERDMRESEHGEGQPT
jgi:hypothetical protein